MIKKEDSGLIVHPIPPLYDHESRILILGSFPSVKSRETAFFYGHPQNRFWKVLSRLLEEPFPETIPDRRALLLRRHIAVWDVIASCEIRGSSDSSIRNVTPNDLTDLHQRADCGAFVSEISGKDAEANRRRTHLPGILHHPALHKPGQRRMEPRPTG